ncbi:MAG: DUF1786 family protein [Desulfosarcinaceae bacterium]|nr:DUF1786 family protein [Desulfosarcinaceae bacterium]
MARWLMLDIGAGTLDLLVVDGDDGQSYKAVVKSPIRTVAETIAATHGPLAVTGGEMGGGRVTALLKERAASQKVVIGESAAATLHHDPDRVAGWGLEIVSDSDARLAAQEKGMGQIHLADVDPRRIASLVTALGVPFEFEAVAVCAQDHGVAPVGVSHLEYRHNLFAEALTRTPLPHTLLFRSDEVPGSFNRLATIAASAAELPTDSVYVMDSGMAAITGAAIDPHASRSADGFVVLDIATSHTVGAALKGEEVLGIFEYHTHDVTAAILDDLLAGLMAGTLSHAAVLAQGGHGAFVRRAVTPQARGSRSRDPKAQCPIIATGPKRRLARDSRYALVWGAPWGDNMMTGTVGLYTSLARRRKEDPAGRVL